LAMPPDAAASRRRLRRAGARVRDALADVARRAGGDIAVVATWGAGRPP
jgi:hypothetical protein